LAHVRDDHDHHRRADHGRGIPNLCQVVPEERPGEVELVRPRRLSQDRPLEAGEIELLLLRAEGELTGAVVTLGSIDAPNKSESSDERARSQSQAAGDRSVGVRPLRRNQWPL